MAKIRLNPDPTFKTKVSIPVPGASPAPVEFTFKHRTREAIVAWMDEVKDKTDVELVQDVASAWELDDEFNAENIARLCNNYAGAGTSILSAYISELAGARSKN